MTTITVEKAYDAYRRSGNAPFLSIDEFHEFWRDTSDKDRAWWFNDFQTGHTSLSKKLLDVKTAFTFTSSSEIDPALRAAIEPLL